MTKAYLCYIYQQKAIGLRGLMKGFVTAVTVMMCLASDMIQL